MLNVRLLGLSVALITVCVYAPKPVFAIDIDPHPLSELSETKVQTLQSVLNWTYINNPTILAARAELKSIQEQLPQAYSNWLPSINTSAGITATDVDTEPDSSADGSTQRDVALSLDQSLFRGGRTFAEIRAARHVIAGQKASLVGLEQDILADATRGYMNVFRDRSLLQLAQNNKEVIEKQLEATRDRFEVGELTRTDVSQAEARFANAQAEIITAEGDLRTSEAIFEQIIGFAPNMLEYPYQQPDLPATLDIAFERAENASPDILFSMNIHRAAEEDIDNVFGELLPQIGVSGQVSRSFDPSPGTFSEQTSSSIGISASLPLYSGGAVRSRVRSAKNIANQRFIEIFEQKRAVRQDVVAAWEEYQSAKAEIVAREAQIKASEVAREGVKAEAEFGARTVLDTLDADQEFLDANVALVSAQRNKVVAEYELLAILGDLTPESLSFSQDYYDYDAYLHEVKWNLFDMDVDRLGQ